MDKSVKPGARRQDFSAPYVLVVEPICEWRRPRRRPFFQITLGLVCWFWVNLQPYYVWPNRSGLWICVSTAGGKSSVVHLVVHARLRPQRW